MSFIEACELAHEIVKAPRRGKQSAQREIKKRGRGSRPEHQSEMREIAALDEGAEKIGHLVIPEAERSEAVRNP
jgi:hypothetical protein